MAKIDKYEMPDELYYTTDHAWVKVEAIVSDRNY